MSKKSKEELYIDKKEFYLEMKEWVLEKRTNPEFRWTDSLCIKFQKIIEGLGRHPSFRSYSYVDEMKDQAMLNIMKYGHNYDPYKIDPQTKKPYNPFSYFNRIAWQAFVFVLNKEKEQQDLKSEYFRKNFVENPDLFIDGGSEYSEALNKMEQMYDNK